MTADDKQAIAFFQREAPHRQILSTLAIVKDRAEQAKVSVGGKT